MADELLKKGIYVMDSFPCSTKDKARIRVQLSAHTKNIWIGHKCIVAVGQSLKVV
jgi:hypothetical protein